MDWELIVVDDGSKDATAERVAAIAARDARIRLISQGGQRGFGSRPQPGIEHSRASSVSLLDSDNFWMPDYLVTMGAALDAAPDAGFAYTDAWGMDGRTRRIRRTLPMAACDRRYEALAGDSRVGGAVVRARRRLSPLRAFITRPLVWRSRRPAEVESAFPDLDRL